MVNVHWKDIKQIKEYEQRLREQEGEREKKRGSEKEVHRKEKG